MGGKLEEGGVNVVRTQPLYTYSIYRGIVFVLIYMYIHIMEEWERVLREKLEVEIPEGIYSIVVMGKKMLTSRGGIIDQMVEEKRAKRFPPQELGDAEPLK